MFKLMLPRYLSSLHLCMSLTQSSSFKSSTGNHFLKAFIFYTSRSPRKSHSHKRMWLLFSSDTFVLCTCFGNVSVSQHIFYHDTLRLTIPNLCLPVDFRCFRGRNSAMHFWFHRNQHCMQYMVGTTCISNNLEQIGFELVITVSFHFINLSAHPTQVM